MNLVLGMPEVSIKATKVSKVESVWGLSTVYIEVLKEVLVMGMTLLMESYLVLIINMVWVGSDIGVEVKTGSDGEVGLEVGDEVGTVEPNPGYSVTCQFPEGNASRTTIYDQGILYGQTVKPSTKTHNVAH